MAALGVDGPGGPGHALALTSISDVTEVGVLSALGGTTAPSDSRLPPLDFTTGLYERSLLTRLARRASPVPNQAVRTCRSPYPGGTRPGACPERQLVECCLHREMSGSAPSL